MAGAVDLAAVKARAEAQQRAASAPAPSAAQSVVAVTEASFQAEVLDRSFQVPVLVVFASARSQASQTLLTDLTPVVQEQNGALVLAQVDVDADLRIAQAMQVQAVPTVMAVIGGQLVPGFEGALAAEQLTQFVGAVVAAGREAGLSGAGAAPVEGQDEPEIPAHPEDPRFDAAEQALAAGDYTLAEQRFQAILDAEPANADAQTAIAQVRLLRRVDSAGEVAAEPAADDVAGQLAAADLQFAGGDADSALRRLLDLLARVAGEDKDTVRTRLIDFFELLGPEDPRVPAARREMARALF